MSCHQMLHAIGTQTSTPCARKKSSGIFFPLLANPRFENGHGRFSQRCATFFASFALTTYMWAGSKREILLAQPSHLGQSETGLSGGEQKGMVTASQPLGSIRRGHKRFDLRVSQKTNQGTCLALVWDGQYPLDDTALCRRLQCGVTKERPDGCQTKVSASRAVVPAFF